MKFLVFFFKIISTQKLFYIKIKYFSDIRIKGKLWHQSPWSGNKEHLFLRSSVKTV